MIPVKYDLERNVGLAESRKLIQEQERQETERQETERQEEEARQVIANLYNAAGARGPKAIQYFDSLLASAEPTLVTSVQVLGGVSLPVYLADGRKSAELKVHMHEGELRYDLEINLRVEAASSFDVWIHSEVFRRLTQVIKITFLKYAVIDFDFKDSRMEHVIFKDEATILDFQFSQVESLQTVEFEGTAHVGSRAFSECEELGLVIFHSDAGFYEGAFLDCVNLEYIVTPSGNLGNFDAATVHRLESAGVEFIITGSPLSLRL